MTVPAIAISGVSKRYAVGAAAPDRSLIDTLGRWAARIGSRRQDEPRHIWALKDISADIVTGERLALIGDNGAGKSTLLKILSRITNPTEGAIRYRGRIGSLLEVGAGFHPQLSGRDNVYLSGAVLGMRRAEIRSKFDEIVDFSGVESYIDEPVKHYSSGMYVRLAFAVAAHLDTEILLVDEVLAVGDAAFQRKCLGRMDEVAREGRTIIFVSHNLTAVQSLCRRALLIRGGRLVADGPVPQVVSNYLAGHGNRTEAAAGGRQWQPDAIGESVVRPISAKAYAAADPESAIDTSTPIAVEWEYEVGTDGAIDQACMQLHDNDGLLIFDQAPWARPRPIKRGRYRTRCVIPGYLLNDGRYVVSFRFTLSGATVLDLPGSLAIDILDSGEARFGWYGKWPGLLRPRLEWSTERLSTSSAGPGQLQ